MLADVQRGGGNSGGGVAPEGLKDEIQTCLALVELAIVIHGAKVHFAVGDGQQMIDAGQADRALEGFL